MQSSITLSIQNNNQTKYDNMNKEGINDISNNTVRNDNTNSNVYEKETSMMENILKGKIYNYIV
jgi:hypothetical protein